MLAESEYKASFDRIDMTKAFPLVFEVLRYSSFPCFDHSGVSSSYDGEKSILKSCSWKSVSVPCSAMFQAVLTDRGVCCAFNMKKAEDMFLSKGYARCLYYN